MRIAFISDIHNYCDSKQGAERIIAATEKEAPDLVLLGGDIISVIKERHEVPDITAACAWITELSQCRTVIYAEGNHEARLRERYPDVYKDYRTSLEAAGVIFLIDGKVNYRDIDIYGVSIDDIYYKKRIPLIGTDAVMPEKYLIGKLGLPDGLKFNILLMHSPMFLEEAADWGAGLVLSGHFHGGTIRLPGGRGLMSPQFHFFNKYCSGVHKKGNTTMIVSRGLGTHTFNIRLNDLPELSIIDIIL